MPVHRVPNPWHTTARHEGTCRACNTPIDEGETIVQAQDGDETVWVHEVCAP